MADNGTSETTRLADGIRRKARELGFEAVGITRLRPSDHAALYTEWIRRGYHGQMSYLARDDAVAARLGPRSRWPALKSAVVVAQHYSYSGSGSGSYSGSGSGSYSYSGADSRSLAEDEGAGSATVGDPSTGVIARYARGRDYHSVVKKKLLELLRWVETEEGRELPTARAYVDTGPILERELGQRAGLGWFGRNTMLIDPRRGSYFFLGSLLLPFELDYDEPFAADRCGSCTACLPACPTGALLGRDKNGAPIMDATRCISYLTIENQGPIPEALRPLMGNRVFGCDICQEACPWNAPKLLQATREPDYLPRVPGLSGDIDPSGSEPDPAELPRPPALARSGPPTDAPSLVELMRMTREEWDRWTRGSAIRRAGYAGLKRNVTVAMGNWLASVAEPPEGAVAVLREALEREEPLVREHAAWALGSRSPAPGSPDS